MASRYASGICETTPTKRNRYHFITHLLCESHLYTWPKCNALTRKQSEAVGKDNEKLRPNKNRKNNKKNIDADKNSLPKHMLMSYMGTSARKWNHTNGLLHRIHVLFAVIFAAAVAAVVGVWYTSASDAPALDNANFMFLLGLWIGHINVWASCAHHMKCAIVYSTFNVVRFPIGMWNCIKCLCCYAQCKIVRPLEEFIFMIFHCVCVWVMCVSSLLVVCSCAAIPRCRPSLA